MHVCVTSPHILKPLAGRVHLILACELPHHTSTCCFHRFATRTNETCILAIEVQRAGSVSCKRLFVNSLASLHMTATRPKTSDKGCVLLRRVLGRSITNVCSAFLCVNHTLDRLFPCFLAGSSSYGPRHDALHGGRLLAYAGASE